MYNVDDDSHVSSYSFFVIADDPEDNNADNPAPGTSKERQEIPTEDIEPGDNDEDVEKDGSSRSGRYNTRGQRSE